MDIPDVNPDVTYCVIIYNSTAIVDSKCNLTVVSYNYKSSYPNDLACGKLNFIVAADNVVGQTNSTSIQIVNKGLFMKIRNAVCIFDLLSELDLSERARCDKKKQSVLSVIEFISTK